MKKRTLLGLILLTSILGGCQVTHVAGEIDGVNIQATTDDHHHSNGKFCPPGQAKKGNC